MQKTALVENFQLASTEFLDSVRIGAVVYASVLCLALFFDQKRSFSELHCIWQPCFFCTLAPWVRTLPSQPVACGRRLCGGVPIPARDPSVPAQVARPWQAAEAGFTAADISTYAGDAGWAQQKVARCRRARCHGAVKISSLPVVLRGWINAHPTAGTKCWQRLSFLFLFLLFLIPSVMVFTAERQQQETEEGLGAEPRQHSLCC